MIDMAAMNRLAESPHFGSRYIGPLPATAGERRQVLDNPLIEGLPGAVTIHLMRTDRREYYADESADVHALVTYSNGATSNAFYCDWDGQFTLPCTKINIQLETYAPTPETYETDQSLEQSFGALLGFGSCAPAGVDGLGYTAQSFDLTPTAWDVVTVPDFARRFFPNVFNSTYRITEFNSPARPMPSDALAHVAIYFVTLQGYTLAAHWLTPRLMADGIVVPGGVNRIFVVNNGATTMRIAPYFRLGL